MVAIMLEKVKYYANGSYIFSVTSTMAPSLKLFTRLTSFFTGSRYDFDFVSGNMEVCQILLPICAVTRIDPKPLAFGEISLITSASLRGKVTKYQEPLPLYSHSFVLNERFIYSRVTLI